MPMLGRITGRYFSRRTLIVNTYAADQLNPSPEGMAPDGEKKHLTCAED